MVPCGACCWTSTVTIKTGSRGELIRVVAYSKGGWSLLISPSPSDKSTKTPKKSNKKLNTSVHGVYMSLPCCRSLFLNLHGDYENKQFGHTFQRQIWVISMMTRGYFSNWWLKGTHGMPPKWRFSLINHMCAVNDVHGGGGLQMKMLQSLGGFCYSTIAESLNSHRICWSPAAYRNFFCFQKKIGLNTFQTKLQKIWPAAHFVW